MFCEEESLEVSEEEKLILDGLIINCSGLLDDYKST